MLAAALDTRLAVAWSSGYLDDSQAEWDQSEDRMLWRLRRALSNEQIAALVKPRRLLTGSALDTTALAKLGDILKPSPPEPNAAHAAAPSMDLEKVSEIANAQFSQWQALFRNAALEAADALQTRWKLDYSSTDAYERSLTEKREAYWELVGRYPAPSGDLQAKSIRVYDEPGFAGWRLSVRVR